MKYPRDFLDLIALDPLSMIPTCIDTHSDLDIGPSSQGK